MKKIFLILAIILISILFVLNIPSKEIEDIEGDLLYSGQSENWKVEIKVDYSRKDSWVRVHEEIILQYLGDKLTTGDSVRYEYKPFSGDKFSGVSILEENGYTRGSGTGHSEKNYKIPTGKEVVPVTILWGENQEIIKVKQKNLKNNSKEKCNDNKAIEKGQAPSRAKPVIYLYPEAEQEVTVKLNYIGELTCTYPEYKDGWRVLAHPNGKILNMEDNKEYSYLFWEGDSNDHWDLSKGFIVEGKDTRTFLEEKLSYMGLIPKEYNEFIVYWLPRMEHNKYNLISFIEKEYDETAALEITPTPDSIRRIFMVFKDIDEPVEIDKQELKPFVRKGFTVIEWGGAELE